MFYLPELVCVKQCKGHPKNVANWHKMKNAEFEWNHYVHLTVLSEIEILSARVDFNELFQKEESKRHSKTLIPVNTSCKQTAQLTVTA